MELGEDVGLKKKEEGRRKKMMTTRETRGVNASERPVWLLMHGGVDTKYI